MSGENEVAMSLYVLVHCACARNKYWLGIGLQLYLCAGKEDSTSDNENNHQRVNTKGRAPFKSVATKHLNVITGIRSSK